VPSPAARARGPRGGVRRAVSLMIEGENESSTVDGIFFGIYGAR
jgi:hypothetical protein